MGVIHLGYGLWAFAAPLAAIARAGFWNAAAPNPERLLAFWFMVAGVVALLLGGLIDWAEARDGGAVPAFVGWGLLGLGVGGAVMLPVSAVWLLFPPAVAALRRRPRA